MCELICEHQELAVAEATPRVQGALGEVLGAARGQVIVGSQLTPPTGLVAELLCSAVLSVVRARLLAADDTRALTALAPSLMEHVLEPYLAAGAAIADRLADPALPPRAPTEARILPLRAHPRVLLALQVIAASPGLSTRAVEQQLRSRRRGGGELSQVLNPLERRGLIEDTHAGHGQRKAWRLTAYGHRALVLLDEARVAPGPRTDGTPRAFQERATFLRSPSQERPPGVPSGPVGVKETSHT